MSNFVVSARKYRPTRFDEVVGQQHISQTLKNALQNNQLAHAFLFCGPRGVGKTTCARILAKTLNCEQRTPEHEACGTCGSCQAFAENSSFNIIELDAASNNSVDNIRTLIDQVRFQPQQGQYKVFIIDEVHMLSAQAFNAFLKTLEEPPPYAIFILATTEKHKILPTILSRCQIFDFRRIQPIDIVQHLQHICQLEGIAAEEEALHIIAQKADGGLRDALSVFDRIVSYSNKHITYDAVIESLNVLDYDYFFRVVAAMIIEDLPTVLLIFDEVLRKGFEADTFVNGLMEHLRTVLMCRHERTLTLMEATDRLSERFKEQAQMASPTFLLTALNLFNECDIHYKTSRNKRLHVEMALIKATHIGRVRHLIHDAPAATPHEGTEKKNPNTDVTPVVATPAPPVVAVVPPTPTATTPAASAPPKSASLKVGLPKLGSLSQIQEAVASYQPVSLRTITAVPLATLQQQWAAYAKTVTSPTLQLAMQEAKLSLQADTLHIIAANAVATDLIKAESLKIVEHCKQQLQLQHFVPEISTDPNAPAVVTERKVVSSTADKLKAMAAINPQLIDFMNEWGLTPEN